jgi:L-alanine-DL-glutamate epimerase-like enolase superfamily enzyme
MMKRRHFLYGSAAIGSILSGGIAPAAIIKPSHKGITVRDVKTHFIEHKYRAPYKFGGTAVDRVTMLHVEVQATAADGTAVTGSAAMPMGNIWSYPSKEMSYEQTLHAMRLLAADIRQITADFSERAHPIEIHHQLQPAYLAAAQRISSEKNLPTPIPKLCTLVVASAFDAALHDAMGKSLAVSSYATYDAACMGYDLSRYLGKEFANLYPAAFLAKQPHDWIWLFHSVGGLDPVTPEEQKEKINDGLPETLAEWIRYDKLQRIKIKLQGENLEWDIARTVAIDRVARATRPDVEWKYCCDFNEKCPDVAYVMEFLKKVGERAPQALQDILYLEQPTQRNILAPPAQPMHAAAKIRPVVIDESLTDIETLLAARSMGYTGLCLKACKGQTHAILMAVAGKKFDMFSCVQDLTCPGASLVHSCGIAAHVPGVSTIESNARQYVPIANAGWEKKFPGIFASHDGKYHTKNLTAPGLSTSLP